MIDSFDEVIEAVRQRADWAVAALWRELHPRLLAYFRAAEPAAAEDLAADTWLDIARSIDRFTGDETDFRRFAFTIARRRLIDHRRRRFRRRTDPVAEVEVGPARDDPAAGALGQATLRLIGQLPKDQAEIVLLRVVAGLEAAEVGRIVGKSAGAVRVTQHRALQRLAALIEQDGL